MCPVHQLLAEIRDSDSNSHTHIAPACPAPSTSDGCYFPLPSPLRISSAPGQSPPFWDAKMLNAIKMISHFKWRMGCFAAFFFPPLFKQLKQHTHQLSSLQAGRLQCTHCTWRPQHSPEHGLSATTLPFHSHWGDNISPQQCSPVPQAC